MYAMRFTQYFLLLVVNNIEVICGQRITVTKIEINFIVWGIFELLGVDTITHTEDIKLNIIGNCSRQKM